MQQQTFRKTFLSILIVFLIGLPACAPAAQASLPATATDAEPTAIVLYYRTPKPSLTPIIPTPTITYTPNPDPEEYFGGMVVSMDEVGQKIPLRLTQNFLLSLGSEYTWSVEIDPPQVVSRNMKITPLPGEQGVYIARRRGEAVLLATGAPACRQSQPPCKQPDVLFQITIVVE
jgi:hypothetical protein